MKKLKKRKLRRIKDTNIDFKIAKKTIFQFGPSVTPKERRQIVKALSTEFKPHV